MIPITLRDPLKHAASVTTALANFENFMKAYGFSPAASQVPLEDLVNITHNKKKMKSRSHKSRSHSRKSHKSRSPSRKSHKSRSPSRKSHKSKSPSSPPFLKQSLDDLNKFRLAYEKTSDGNTGPLFASFVRMVMMVFHPYLEDDVVTKMSRSLDDLEQELKGSPLNKKMLPIMLQVISLLHGDQHWK